MTDSPAPQDVRDLVRDGYAKVATAVPASGCCGPSSGGGCCGEAPMDAATLAQQIGYSPEQLAALPAGANMGLSCGNPTAIAALRPGDIVVDLGSGGGFDVFLSGPKVGAEGRAIGVDMTPEMLSKARRNIAQYRESTGLDNVEFRLGEIEHLPLPDASATVVISNCVINLSPEKDQVWREIARILKPGGRVAVSDLALLRPFPEAVRGMVEALVGCIAGAVLVKDYAAMARAAGLTNIVIEHKPEYIATLQAMGGSLIEDIQAKLPPGTTPADYVTSISVTAVKPA